MNDNDPKISSREIAYVTGIRHKRILAEVGETLIAAGINPEPFWHASITKKELYLPRMEAMIGISGDFFSNKQRTIIRDIFKIWDAQELIDDPEEIAFLLGMSAG